MPLLVISGCSGLVAGANNSSTSSALVISSVQAASTTTSGAQISWTTNVAGNSLVSYGTTVSYGSSTPVDPTMVTNHVVSISGLAAGTTYYYQVQSTDSKSDNGQSGGYKFATAGISISGTITPAQGGGGATVTLSGAASATTTPNSSGAYTFTGLASGSYSVTPSNATYSFTPASQNVSLTTSNMTSVNFSAATIASAPAITTQPVNQAVIGGQTATFTVVASGTAPLNYQWQKNGANIAGAASSSYTTPAATTSDSGSTFDVVVSNGAGTVTSSAATLTVNAATAAPSIATQPVNQTVTTGQTATFVVVASGTAPLSYQWQKNGANITGAASSSYTTPATTTADSGSTFDVVVSNSAGTVTSNTATLTVNAAAAAPTIATQPVNETVTAGQAATFTVVANGTTPLSYQWQKSGTAISGATSASYTTPVTTTSDNGAQFTVVVSNSAGSVTSNVATLTVNAATLSLNANPTSLSFGNVNVGSSGKQNVTFTNSGNSSITVSNVTIGGPGYNVSGVSTGQVIAAGQNATLTVTFAPSGSGSATGSASVASDATNSPATIPLSGSGVSQTGSSGMPTCGKSGDTSNHVPTDWGTFVPPAKGQSYVDGTFGCTVTRVTDVSKDDWNGTAYLPVGMGYATVSPFNANDTYLMLVDGWNRHYVTDLSGNQVVPISSMPGGNDGWFLWDAANAAVFYYTSGNSLMKGTISGSTVATATVHQFTEYAAVNFMDETDVSQDGAHVVMVGGDTSGSSPENIFVYNFAANTKGPVYTTGCVATVNSTNNGCLHKLIQTPDNNVIIQFANDGTGAEQGNRLWDGTTPMAHLQDFTNHLDAGSDLNGNAVFIESGNTTTVSGFTNPCPSGWGYDVRQIYNPTQSVCLLDNQPSVHVGYRGNAQQPWVVVSTDDMQTKPNPQWFDNNGNYTGPTASNWHLYDDEILVVRVDANNNSSLIYRLARGYSRTDEDFNAQLKAAISRDGKYIAFDSNMAYAHTGCPANFQSATNCADVYVIKVK